MERPNNTKLPRKVKPTFGVHRMKQTLGKSSSLVHVFPSMEEKDEGLIESDDVPEGYIQRQRQNLNEKPLPLHNGNPKARKTLSSPLPLTTIDDKMTAQYTTPLISNDTDLNSKRKLSMPVQKTDSVGFQVKGLCHSGPGTYNEKFQPTDMPFERQESYEIPMHSIDDESVPIASIHISTNNPNLLRQSSSSDSFRFQKPLPPGVTSTRAPPPRRQLSKRKSESMMDQPSHRSSSASSSSPPSSSSGLLDSLRAEDRRALDDDEEESEEDDWHSFGRGSEPCTPQSPKAPRMGAFDPFQNFQVNHTPCLMFTVRVLRARNVTLGMQDYFDTPDPYVNLNMRSSPEGHKVTTVKHDDPNPTWDETFTFFLNLNQTNLLEISLMEYNSVWWSQQVGETVSFSVPEDINEMNLLQVETFVFNTVTEVDIEFKIALDSNPTLRYSLALSDAEKAFIDKRKQKVMEGVAKLVGKDHAPRSVEEVPNIAVLGSGGGFRALTAYSGVFKALQDSGVLDCVSFACGLSGSSWFLSSLYSHPKWPDLDIGEFQEEIKKNMEKSWLSLLTPLGLLKYTRYMVSKRQEGQPVSFTDFFGRLVGDVLMPDRTMDCTLTGQREKIKDGRIPMPLYTCVHVKKDVPARRFQEWVEFSPYEIGMPKYGTFMDSELFGSKFFMGKLVKKFKEQPLNFLQGIWGSAFCILFKRLFEDNSRIDPAEMMRQEYNDSLIRDEMDAEMAKDGDGTDSDCSDEEIDLYESSFDSSVGGSFDGSFDSEENITPNSSSSNNLTSLFDNKSEKGRLSGEDRDMEEEKADTPSEDLFSTCHSFVGKQNSFEKIKKKIDYTNKVSMEEDDEEEENSQLFSKCKPPLDKRGSLEKLKTRREVDEEVSHQNGSGLFKMAAANNVDPCDMRKSVSWGACPAPVKGQSQDKTSDDRRKEYKRRSSSMRKTKSGSKSYWKTYLKSMVEGNWEILNSRKGRAAVIHNFMRGLDLEKSYPLSPYTPRVQAGDEFDGMFEMHPTSVKHIYMVDAGLTFNSPYPLVLRPQRDVDIILSFDFSGRDTDDTQPFKELQLAEKWARINRLPFPPIDVSVFDKEDMKTLYIFRHPDDPLCPIVFHFVLVNTTFRDEKKPGIPRGTKAEKDFGDFKIFDDPKAPYSTFNFTYTNESFERLSQLTEYNTLLHIEEIKEVIKDIVKWKQRGSPRLSTITGNDIKMFRMKSVVEHRKLKRFMSRLKSRSSLSSSTTRSSSPSTPFFTPCPQSTSEANPFFTQGTPPGAFERTPQSSFEKMQSFDHSRFLSKLNNKKSSQSSNSSSERDSVFGTPPERKIGHFHFSYSRSESEHQEWLDRNIPDRLSAKLKYSNSVSNVHEGLDILDGVSHNHTHGTTPSETSMSKSADVIEKATNIVNSVMEGAAQTVNPNEIINTANGESIPDNHDLETNLIESYESLTNAQSGSESESPCDMKKTSCPKLKIVSPLPNSESSSSLNSLGFNSPKLRIISPLSGSDSSSSLQSLGFNSPDSFSSNLSSIQSLDNINSSNFSSLGNSSGYGSVGCSSVDSHGEFLRLQSSDSSGSIFGTPSSIISGTPTLGINASSSENGSAHKEPPNPFFKNYLKQRSYVSQNSSDKSRLSPHVRGSSYRKKMVSPLAVSPLGAKPQQTLGSQRSIDLSNLVREESSKSLSSGVKPDKVHKNNSPNQTNNSLGATNSESKSSLDVPTSDQVLTSDEEEAFHLAPEAFKSDGTPVTDSKEAKMFYAPAKQKRAVFRRQSTVSSLNSISLDDNGISRELEVESQDNTKTLFSARDFFFSCSDEESLMQAKGSK